jgi:hypothetical protein
MKHTWILGLAVVILALAAIPAVAQPVVSAKSGTIAYIEGNVFLDEQPVEVSVSHFPNIQEKSVVRTEEGRAEILLTPGVTLRLGEKGSLRMITNRLIDTRLELTGGSAVVVADRSTWKTRTAWTTGAICVRGTWRWPTSRRRRWSTIIMAATAGPPPLVSDRGRGTPISGCTRSFQAATGVIAILSTATATGHPRLFTALIMPRRQRGGTMAAIPATTLGIRIPRQSAPPTAIRERLLLHRRWALRWDPPPVRPQPPLPVHHPSDTALLLARVPAAAATAGR